MQIYYYFLINQSCEEKISTTENLYLNIFNSLEAY